MKAESEANACTPFVQTLLALHEDLCAYLFLFIEVGCVGKSSASCRHMRSCLWTHPAFWQTYAGPCFTSEPNIAELQAPALREVFRKWLFHLDGGWVQDFRDFIEESKNSEFGADFTLLLSDARYVASGLMPHDCPSAVREFARLLCQLLAEYNSSQLDERQEAEALAAQVERRGDVFSEEEVREVALALDRSIEQAILDQPAEDGDLEPEQLLDTLEDASDDEHLGERHDDLFGALGRGIEP